MSKQKNRLSRRRFLGALGAGAAVGLPLSAASTSLPNPPAGKNPLAIAEDEGFWSDVATFYNRTTGIVNLEHGYWGKMARPVEDAYIAATQMVNTQNSFYARKNYAADEALSAQRVAAALGVHADEIVLTRNATEAIHNLIRQYRGLHKGDAVLFADIDYPHFKSAMRWLKDARDVRLVELIIPPRASQAEIFDLYVNAFEKNPDIRLMLLMHVSNQHGLTVPVAQIAATARERGIDLIADCAQSWGLLDYKLPLLGVDWAGFNLHKWLGAPVGVGALYMRRGSLEKIAPYPGVSDPENQSAAARVHTATSNFAAVLAIPPALDFHAAIGGANKEARLRYLRRRWTGAAENMGHIELLGGRDEASWSGMGSFRLAGQSSVAEVEALRQRLETEFGIFTVVRKGLASGYCVRITPQVFTHTDEIDKLVGALGQLA